MVSQQRTSHTIQTDRRGVLRGIAGVTLLSGLAGTSGVVAAQEDPTLITKPCFDVIDPIFVGTNVLSTAIFEGVSPCLLPVDLLEMYLAPKRVLLEIQDGPILLGTDGQVFSADDDDDQGEDDDEDEGTGTSGEGFDTDLEASTIQTAINQGVGVQAESATLDDDQGEDDNEGEDQDDNDDEELVDVKLEFPAGQASFEEGDEATLFYLDREGNYRAITDPQVVIIV